MAIFLPLQNNYAYIIALGFLDGVDCTTVANAGFWLAAFDSGASAACIVTP